MKLNGREILVCSCEDTMAIDGKALAKACGGGELRLADHLCRSQIGLFLAAAKAGGPLLVGCTQEAPLFADALGDLGDAAPEIGFVNLREHAGWSDAGRTGRPAQTLTAKMAALLAAAAVPVPPTDSVAMTSAGAVLVLGRDDVAVAAARELAGRLDVTLLLTPDAEAMPPRQVTMPLFGGRVVRASGHLGGFEVTVAELRAARPASRARLEFAGTPQNRALMCDLILDLRGGTALFPAAEKRDGYFRPDPNNPALVAAALLKLTELVGEFTKPRYVDYRSDLCAHGRNQITGCSRCLDHCPAGAIAPDGDFVRYDHQICAGCGSCASVCPTGAVSYALPAAATLHEQLRTLLRSYAGAGGTGPVLLAHDGDHGETMLDLLARYGRGLPARVLPFQVNQATQIGVDFAWLALAYGAERVLVLLPPAKREERQALDAGASLAESVTRALGYGRDRVMVLDADDPDALGELLYQLEPLPALDAGGFLAMGAKRSVQRLALGHLHRHAPNPVDAVALAEGAPFGAIAIDAAGCTLCLSCVAVCPAGALADHPDKPQVSFKEDACVQCGLCRATCPEHVITLTPRLNFRDEARHFRVLHEDEPFCCVRCGKPFAAAATINRMVEKLGSHAMFAGAKLERLKMCADCRVVAMMEQDQQPLQAGTVPRPRTTTDYYPGGGDDGGGDAINIIDFTRGRSR